MSARRVLLAAALATTLGGAHAQTVVTYTQSQTGPGLLTYGLPVPLPIDSLTPVDGFRSHASLEARLQSLALESPDLSAHDVGDTFNGRTLWAYVVGDADGTDVEGRAESAFFINAATHAREWAAPEVSTGTIERLLAGAGDGGLVRYLLDNTRLVIIPVHNVDGFLQTQRHPTQAIVGGDPDNPNWPRDGRMRRKNMRGVDENLLTFADRLNGIDLNRNHPPFWATAASGGGSSNNPASLTFHGAAPQSEPEVQAMLAAAQLAPASRIRLGIDVHSFSAVYFSINTSRARLNGIQSRLIGRMQQHHLSVANKFYQDAPNLPNQGIGTAAEYFAYQWLVPAWTLELEPTNSPVEYGGLNVNHGGFILPASQARRVREGWAETHLVAFYMMAGPPHLARVRFHDAQTNELVGESRWRYDPNTGRRERLVLPPSLRPGARYRVELAFNKPMRYRNAAGELAALPGAEGVVAMQPAVALLRGGARAPLDTSGGAWLTDAARTLRYRDDTFAFEFNAPTDIDAAGTAFQLEVETTDLVGHRLDADPSTPADWSEGAWSEYENTDGSDGDFGGTDVATSLQVAVPGPLELFGSGNNAAVVGEGDTVALRFRLPTAAAERIDLLRFETNGSFPPPTVVATWQPGETGERTVEVAAPDDLVANGDEQLSLSFRVQRGDATVQSFAPSYTVLENDASDLGVLRVRESAALQPAWNAVRLGTAARQLVLDGNRSYELPVEDGGSPPRGLPPVESSLTVSGNRARFVLPGVRLVSPFLEVAASGDLRLYDLRIDALNMPESVPPVSPFLSAVPAFRNAGRLEIHRSRVQGVASATSRDNSRLFDNRGEMRIDRSLIADFYMDRNDAVGFSNGRLTVSSSTWRQNHARNQVYLEGELRWLGSTLASNIAYFHSFEAGSPAASLVFGNALLQDNVEMNLTSPVFANATCADVASTSLGYNLDQGTGCGFSQAGDRNGVDLPALTVEPITGTLLPVGEAVDGGALAAQATTSGCGPVDQRGAPRPQTLTVGAMPRCDIGASELGINPYRGIWQPARNGHGVELHTSGNQLLLVWYTYADDGSPTSYQAAAPLTGPRWEADLLQPRRDPQTGAVTAPRVGRVTIDFAADDDATLGWRFDSRGTDGSERIRPAFFAAGEPRFEVSGVWYAPVEPGYGATITRRGEVTAVVLYYYDGAGNIRWVLGSANGADALSIPMSSFTGFCPDCNAAAMPVQSVPAGSVLVHFQTPGRARLDTTVTYPGTQGGTWNRQRAALVPLSDPVDNRATAPSTQ